MPTKKLKKSKMTFFYSFFTFELIKIVFFYLPIQPIYSVENDFWINLVFKPSTIGLASIVLRKFLLLDLPHVGAKNK